MGNRYASGKNSIAICDRCGFQFKLTNLRKEIVKTKVVNTLVCPSCFDPDQPQLQLGMYPVDDPQGLRNPRPDRSYVTSGTSGLQIVETSSPDPLAQGTLEMGSRIIQWGWNPVGGASLNDLGLTPNSLVLTVNLGTVTVATT